MSYHRIIADNILSLTMLGIICLGCSKTVILANSKESISGGVQPKKSCNLAISMRMDSITNFSLVF